MKVDKRKLFYAIRDNKTEIFKMTDDKDLFDYSPEDFTALGIFRLFPNNDEFKCVDHIKQQDIATIYEGFNEINQELIKLGCVNGGEINDK